MLCNAVQYVSLLFWPRLDSSLASHEAFAPLTAEGAMLVLDHYGVQLKGIHAVAGLRLVGAQRPYKHKHPTNHGFGKLLILGLGTTM